MKCHVCDADKPKGVLTPLGFACEDCKEASRAEWKEIIERERAAELDDGPDEYDLPEFERFALRLAVKCLDVEEFRAEVAERNPMLLDPSEFSLLLKDVLINHMPQYFSTFEARGHERIFHGGTYRIIGTIPKQKAVEAAYSAGILTE